VTESPPNPPPMVTHESDTRALLREILIATQATGVQFKFVCPRGASPAIMSRVRMMLSRTRKQMEAKNIRFKQFRLMSDCVPLVNTAKELVIVWQSQSSTNQLDSIILGTLAAPIETLLESK
jgi:hypothetical protein